MSQDSSVAAPPPPPAERGSTNDSIEEKAAEQITPETPRKDAPSPPSVLETMDEKAAAAAAQPVQEDAAIQPPTSPSKAAPSPPRRPPPLKLSLLPNTATKPPPRLLNLTQALRGPLGRNPPTRPSTAATEVSTATGSTAPIRLVGSNKRLSWSSVVTAAKKRIKYGSGKHSNIELVPQPSDDPDDPLNWPQWKKELNLGALLFTASMTGVMKTALIPVNSVLAQNYAVSYTSIAALTGVPLLLSVVTGAASVVASRICGKRPLYLASVLLLFIGTIWNTNVQTSYGQCMAARVFQGLGWGAFDTLITGSIHDTYFEHERCLRIAIHSIVSMATTWGGPLIGGVASQTDMGFGLQFTILSCFFVLALPLMALGAPETAFDRPYTIAQTPATGASYGQSLSSLPRRGFSLEACKDYAAQMKPVSYSQPADSTILLQAPRAFLAPTTLLLFLVTLLPSAALWGLASSTSLIFSTMPFMLSPSSLGALMTGPFLLATIAVAAFALNHAWHIRFSRVLNLGAIAGGSILSLVGLLALGLHVGGGMSQPPEDKTVSVFALDNLGGRVSFPAVGFVLGLIAAAAAVLDSTTRPLIRRSTQFTSSNLGVALRNTADMEAGVGLARTLVAGAMVLGLPNRVWSWDGLRMACVGIAVAQVVVAAGVGAVWWFWDEHVRRLDGKVMRLVDLDNLRTPGSFFDTD